MGVSNDPFVVLASDKVRDMGKRIRSNYGKL